MIPKICDFVFTQNALLFFDWQLPVTGKFNLSVWRCEMSVLDEFFGPRPLNEDLIEAALKGTLDVMVRPGEGRVSVLKRGQRVDEQLAAHVAAEVIRAYNENALMSLLPRRGRSSANLRVFKPND
jgi:hypothetical protein